MYDRLNKTNKSKQGGLMSGFAPGYTARKYKQTEDGTTDYSFERAKTEGKKLIAQANIEKPVRAAKPEPASPIAKADLPAGQNRPMGGGKLPGLSKPAGL
jgi:hypothetical protein